MDDSESIVALIRDLLERVELLEAEREVRAVLARYGFYADHGLDEEWLDLFTDDGAIELVKYTGEDLMNIDPNQFTPMRFEGRDQLRAGMMESASHKSVAGRSQHHLDGPPAIFKRIDDETAVVFGYGVVYSKTEGSYVRQVEYQSHNMNRWTFKKVDGHWKIAECFRRQMESPESALIFGDPSAYS